MARLIIDGMNVIGSRPTGWWRDRHGAMRRFVEQLQVLANATSEPLAVVFDGRPLDDLAEGKHGLVEVRYARRGGRNAADARIEEMVSADADPASLTVVTSDAALRASVQRLGAATHGAGWLLHALDAASDTRPPPSRSPQ
jgi:predicted RNA-binding protein with PIN domain